MRTYKNEIVIHRNETFTMDKRIINSDGSPYLISSQLGNPYFLVTVKETLLNGNSYRFWLPIKEQYKQFRVTHPVPLESFTTNVGVRIYEDYPLDRGPRGYIDGVYYDFNQETDAVFSLYNESTGVTSYKYYHQFSSGQSVNLEWYDYNCDLTVLFTQEETKLWKEQDYFYNIQLVNGIPTKEYLENLCTERSIIYYENDSVAVLYDRLIRSGYVFSADFDKNAPINNYNVVLPLLTPTKLTVLSNLGGEM